MSFLNRSIAKAPSTVAIKPVAATGLEGAPSTTMLQPRSASFPADRPQSLVGFTGGWTDNRGITPHAPAMGSPIAGMPGQSAVGAPASTGLNSSMLKF